jgi:Tn3 transposase DDE domain
VVFGLFWLLGYRFSPRIADIGGARYWRIDPSADYGPLNDIAAHRINTKLIAEHWDDLLRLAGSLKLGVVQATSIMRTLQIGDVQQDWRKPSPSWAASIKQFMRSLTSTMKPNVVVYSSNLTKAKIVINWPELSSTESGANSASDIMKDRKISSERSDWS